jgi:hypothetical protein
MLFIGKAKLHASRPALYQAPLYQVVILDRATTFPHNVEYPLPVCVAVSSPYLPIALAERDGVNSLLPTCVLL